MFSLSRSVKNKPVVDFYYKKAPEAGQDLRRCKCSVLRNQKPNSGSTNLFSHIGERHPIWKEKIKTKNTLAQVISAKRQPIFNWLEWLIKDNLEFTFVDSKLTQKNTKLTKICRQTPVKCLDKTVEIVDQEITRVLTESFKILIDGWTRDSVHYFALFACYHEGSSCITVLLAIAPVLNEDDLSASRQIDFITATLGVHGRLVTSLNFKTFDNEPTNKK